MVLTFKAVSGPMKGHQFIVKVNSSKKFSMGRSRSTSMSLYDDPFVSRNHGRIILESSGLVIEDCGSKNGTYVNGKSIKRSALLIGCEILIGKTKLQFKGISEIVSKGEG